MLDVKNMSDPQLCRAVINNIAGAETEFFERYYSFVKHTCAQMLTCRHDVQDAAQEIMFNVIVRKKIISYRGDAAIRSWLYRVSINTCKIFIRKKKRMQERFLQDWMLIAGRHPDYLRQENNILQKLEKDQERQKVIKQLNHLPQKYREAIQYSCLLDYSYKQAAQQLNISISTLGVRLNRAKKMLMAFNHDIKGKVMPELKTYSRKVSPALP